MKSEITGIEIDHLTYWINSILLSLQIIAIIVFLIQAVYYNIAYYALMWTEIYISYKFLRVTFQESIYGEYVYKVRVWFLQRKTVTRRLSN